MRVLILGGDGYLGWPTAMHLASSGHDVAVVDNYFKRGICSALGVESLLRVPVVRERADRFGELGGAKIGFYHADCADHAQLGLVVRGFSPDAVVHYAEQPSGPWSMTGHAEASKTLNNNLNSTLNLAWSVIEHAPECHIVKLGTLGEYGTPNTDIPEGFFDFEYKGRSDRRLFPREAGSLYHTTKILDTDLLWFYVRNYGLSVTDLMQGPVYGLHTAQTLELGDPSLLTHFYYDDIFGTAVNRFLVQALLGVPLTVYGGGGQTRGYLNLVDTLQCVQLAVENRAKAGELRVFNQFTEQFSVLDIAHRVQEAGRELGLDVTTQVVENPRIEAEEHYYKASHSKLPQLGLEPTLMSTSVLVEMLEALRPHVEAVNLDRILPSVRWGQVSEV